MPSVNMMTTLSLTDDEEDDSAVVVDVDNSSGGERRAVLSFDMGSRNLAFALVRPPSNTIERMGLIDLGKHAARQATEALVNSLSASNAWMFDAGHDVVVELQPSGGVCKALSHVLQACFLFHDNTNNVTDRAPFLFMAAGNKLRYDLDVFNEMCPQTYTQRKRCAMRMAETILDAQPTTTCADFYASFDFKQQSDLADAIVQGVRYIQRRQQQKQPRQQRKK